jgi:hypothetical protein
METLLQSKENQYMVETTGEALSEDKAENRKQYVNIFQQG